MGGDNKCVNFLVTGKKLLKKYSEIWGKIKSLSKKEFDKEPLYNNKHITSKVDVYMGTEFKYEILEILFLLIQMNTIHKYF